MASFWLSMNVSAAGSWRRLLNRLGNLVSYRPRDKTDRLLENLLEAECSRMQGKSTHRVNRPY
jgi:hypothetical protein